MDELKAALAEKERTESEQQDRIYALEETLEVKKRDWQSLVEGVEEEAENARVTHRQQIEVLVAALDKGRARVSVSRVHQAEDRQDVHTDLDLDHHTVQ